MAARSFLNDSSLVSISSLIYDPDDVLATPLNSCCTNIQLYPAPSFMFPVPAAFSDVCEPTPILSPHYPPIQAFRSSLESGTPTQPSIPSSPVTTAVQHLLPSGDWGSWKQCNFLLSEVSKINSAWHPIAICLVNTYMNKHHPPQFDSATTRLLGMDSGWMTGSQFSLDSVKEQIIRPL